MYRLPGRKPAAVRADVAKLSRLAATYVRASDAYQIDEAELQPLGGTRRSAISSNVEALRMPQSLRLPKCSPALSTHPKVAVLDRTARGGTSPVHPR